MSGFLLSYGLQRKERRERKEGGQNCEKLNKKECPSRNSFRDTAFRRIIFFSSFARKSLLLKKPSRICIIDGPTRKFSADDSK